MCVNMTAENFQEWVKMTKAVDVEVEFYGDPDHKKVKVIDARVPSDWLITDPSKYHLY